MILPQPSNQKRDSPQTPPLPSFLLSNEAPKQLMLYPRCFLRSPPLLHPLTTAIIQGWMISCLSAHRVSQLASEPSMNPIKLQGDHVPSLLNIAQQISLVYGVLSPFMHVGQGSLRPMLILCSSQTSCPALALPHPAPTCNAPNTPGLFPAPRR